MDEFELIRRFFSQQEAGSGVVTGIGDDGAVLAPTPHTEQVQVIDTLVSNVHFPEASDPGDVAYRAVAVNLSDIAAMGAVPRWMTLALTMPEVNESWLSGFSRGLNDAAQSFHVALVGGDTCRGPTLTITVSISGEVVPGTALLRSGANAGDEIFVSGTIGDAAGGLETLAVNDPDAELVRRFYRPTPRVALGQALIGRATAAIDLSDGLAADLAKMLTASGKGAEIDVERIPISPSLRGRFDAAACQELALIGGDDYELCFAAGPGAVADLDGISRIGRVTDAADLVFRRGEDIVQVDSSGYCHFQ